jgi:hypothetical protein
MSKPRLLASFPLASILLASGSTQTAAAQALTPSGPPPLAASDAPTALFNTSRNQPLSAATLESTPQRFDNLAAANHLSTAGSQQASAGQGRPLCFTLRSYNFTERDLKSPHPRASSEIDCTPATKGHFRTGKTTTMSPWQAQPSTTSQPASASNQSSHHR